MPPIEAIGTSSRYFARKAASMSLSTALKTPASGEIAPTLMLVAVRASAPVCGKPLNNGMKICTSPCPQQGVVGVERRALVLGQAVGHLRTQQALDRRDEDDRGDEVGQVPQRLRVERDRRGHVEYEEVGRDGAVFVFDQRQPFASEERRGEARRHCQTDQWSGDERRHFEQVLRNQECEQA